MALFQELRPHGRLFVAVVLVVTMVLSPLSPTATNAQSSSIDKTAGDDIPVSAPRGRSPLSAADLTEARLVHAQGNAAEPTGQGHTAMAEAAMAEAQTYIVILQGDALAGYRGDIAGLSATNPKLTGKHQLDLQSNASVAYLAHIQQQQIAFIERMDRTIGRNVAVRYRYQLALNGFAAELAPSEADQLRKLPGVKRIIPDWIETVQTDAGPIWQGVDAIWGGTFTDLHYQAELSGANEVPPVSTAASGLGSFWYNMDTKELRYEITVSAMSQITAAQIHAAAVGANGAAHFPLYVGDGAFGPDTPLTGAVTLTATTQANLVNGQLYLDITTAAHPMGEVRGQIRLHGSMGEGVIVGIIDTGINIDHPSFAATGGDGYNHTNPRGKYYGWCDPSHPRYDPTLRCNDKLIGLWSADNDSPEDAGDHGSHVASTAAGNILEEVVVHAPTTDVTLHRISGVAPHANLIGYNIESVPGSGSATGAATIAATEQAIADQVDVINYSFGGGAADPWVFAEHWRNVREAGIFVATSAGNSGAAEGTVGTPGNAPWLMTVGASSHNRQFGNRLLSLSGGDSAPPVELDGEGVTGGYGPAPILYAGTFDPNNRGCDLPYSAGTFHGEIVLCDYNTGAQYSGRVNKSINLANAGAGGFLLVNRPEWQAALMVDSYALPGLSLSYRQGEQLKTWLAGGSGQQGTIRGVAIESARGDIMAGFSSRGPNEPLPNVLKPDITAPGRRIVAAIGSRPGRVAPEFDIYQGTSMASPHVAGAAALVHARHPEWTPAEIQSALMTTARHEGILKEDATTLADPFDMGAGRVDLTKAADAALVLEETTANLWAANPATGGDPRALNLPSLADTQCVYRCRWHRIVTSTRAVAETWHAAGLATDGVTIAVEPAQFTLVPGATQEIVVTATVTSGATDKWLFGWVQVTPESDAPATVLPVALFATTGILPSTVDITTRRNAGSQLIAGLQTVPISDLTIETHGLTSSNVISFSLAEDRTHNDPYDNLNDGTTNFYTITVPAGALHLTAEILKTTAPDLDLYVGQGNRPSAATQVCSSANNAATESCQVASPAAGDWWILVQNWRASAAAADDGSLAVTLLAGTTGNLWVEGPDTVPPGQPLDLRLYWNEPTLEAETTYYGGFTIGTDPAHPGNIGTILVTLNRSSDDVTMTVSPTVASPRDTVTYQVIVEPNSAAEDLSYSLTDALPDGLTYVTGSAATNNGTVTAAGNVLSWSGEMPAAIGTEGKYIITTNQNDAMCASPFGGGYVDLETFGIQTQAGLAGDTQWFQFGSHAGTEFYGVAHDDPPWLTDDGIAVFGEDPGSPWLNQHIPDPTAPNGLFAPYWRDMEIVYDAATNSGVSAATAAGTFWVVEYDDIQAYGDPTTTLDMEIMAWKESNPSAGSYDAFYAYDNVHVADTIGTIGVEDNTGATATQFSHNSFTPTNGLVLCLDYVGHVPTVITFDAVVTATEGVIINTVTHNTTDPGSQEATTSAELQIEDQSVLFLSTSTSGKIGSLQYRDEDILAYDTNTGIWRMLFDGSDVGLSNNDINALQVARDGTIYMSFARTRSMQNVTGYHGPPILYSTSIYTFIPDALGWNTAGRFALFFDGSAVGLESASENIDALYIAGNGTMLISTLGTANVPGVDNTILKAKDEDLLRFTPTKLGEETAGSWQLFLDGSAEGLSSSDEDVWGTWYNRGRLYLTTRGPFAVEGLSGDGADAFACEGAPCHFSPIIDGSTIGLANQRVDDFSFGAMPALLDTAQTRVMAEDSTVELDDEADDDILDEDDIELTNHVYLPSVTR